MAIPAGTLVVLVTPDLAGFSAQLSAGMNAAAAPAAAAFSQRLSASLKSAGSNLSRAGRTLTRTLTLPLVAVGAIATKTALDYDKAFTSIAAITNASAEQVSKWREEVLALSGETARAPQELAEALYYLASAGLKAADIMPVLESSAKAAATGLGTTADVAKLTANVLNAYADSGITAADVTDTLVAAVKAGTAEPDEFANALGRILPIASRAKVSFNEVTASLASLSNIGLGVNEGVTAMRGLLTALVAPTSMAADEMKRLGISTDEMRATLEEGGLPAALELLEEKSKGNIDVLRLLIPNVRSLVGELGLTGENAEQVARIFDEVAHSAGAANEAFETTQESDAFKFADAMNDLRLAGIHLGNELIPILVDDVVPAIQDMTHWFTSLSDSSQALLIKLSGLAIVAGPLLRLAGVLLKVGGAAASLFRVSSAVQGTAAAAAGAGSGVGGLSGLGAALSGISLSSVAAAAGAGVVLAGLVDGFIQAQTNAESAQQSVMRLQDTIADGGNVYLQAGAEVSHWNDVIDDMGDQSWTATNGNLDELDTWIAKFGAVREGFADIFGDNQIESAENALNKINEGVARFEDNMGDALIKASGFGRFLQTSTSGENQIAAIGNVPELFDTAKVYEQATAVSALEKELEQLVALTGYGVISADSAQSIAALEGAYVGLTGSTKGLRLEAVELYLREGDVASAMALLTGQVDKARVAMHHHLEEILHSREASQRWADVITDASGLLRNQRTQLAASIRKVEGFAGSIKGARADLLEAYIATGNFTGAQGALQGALAAAIAKMTNAKDKASDYIGVLNEVPPKVLTDILARTDSAKSAVKALMAYIESQNPTLDVAVKYTNTGPPPFQAGGGRGDSYTPPTQREGAARGAYIPGGSTPQVITVGEKSRAEMILPLENEEGHRKLVRALRDAGYGARSFDADIRITNWATGEGRMRGIAREETDGERRQQGVLARMQR